MFLIHTKTSRVILLQRVILQIYKSKEKIFVTLGKGGCCYICKNCDGYYDVYL